MREIYSSTGQTRFIKSYKMALNDVRVINKLAISILIFLFVGFNNTAVAQGPGAAWEYSRNIAISGTGTPMADYQVQVKLTPGLYGGMNANGSDLRFYAGTTACNYWIEKWDLSGMSVIWVKVPTTNTTVLTMYYGNPTATSAESAGTDVFDFFEDFNATLNSAIWAYGGVSQSGSNVSVPYGGFISNKTAFSTSPASSSFFLETKHKESGYYRVRYYATTATGSYSVSQTGTRDYGYFQQTLGTAIGSTFWDGTGLDGNPKVYANTNCITQWKITDNSSLTWSTFNYDTAYNVVSFYTTPISVSLRYITIAVTEKAGTGTSVDWVRVRKSAGGVSDSTTIGQQIQISPSNITFTPGTYCAGANDTVTINGTYLNNTTAVSINGVNATTIIPVSISRIQVTFPSGITTGPIIVTTAGGPATSAANLTINPLPGVFNVGGGGSYCAGTSGLPINLSGSEIGVNYQLIKDASSVGSPLPGTGLAISFGLQTATGAYSVLAISPTTGCEQTMNGSQNVIINALPTAYNITPSTGSYCADGIGAAVGLSGSQAGVSYQLYSGVTAIGSPVSGTGGAISFGNHLAGTYTVKATNTATSCTADMIASTVITENPLPSGTIAVTETSGSAQNDGKICKDDAITFTATAGFSSYIFKVNGSPVVPQPGSNVYTTSTLAVGNPTITVDITDSKTCGSTFTTLPVTINVIARPTGALAPDVNNVCPGTKVTFNAPTGNSNYVFKVTNGATLKSTVNTGGLSSYSSTTLISGDIVSVDVTNANGCTQTFTAVPMVFKPIPAAAGSISGSPVVCRGQIGVPFSVPAITNATSYTWTLPAGMTIASGAGTNNVTINFLNTATSGNISVAGTNDCGNGTASASYYVTVNPLPTASISGNATICRNAPASIIFTGAGGTAPYTFSYNINGGTTQVATSTGSIAIITPATNVDGAFTYNLIGVKDASTTSCFNTISGSSVKVTVNPLPTATISGNSTVCQDGFNPTITFTGANGTGPYTFSYSVNGAATQTVVSTGNTATVSVPTNQGTQTYTLTSVEDGSSTTCSQSLSAAPVVVNVNPLPTASISVANNKVCQNAPAKPVVTFTGSVGSAPFTFTYNINGGANQTITTTSGSSVTLTPPVNVPGLFTYNLVSVKSTTTGCESAQTGSVAVTIDTLPLPILIGPDQICPDQTLDYSTESGNSIHNFVWTINNGLVVSGGSTSDNTVQVHWANNTLPKFIYVNYTDGNGCQGVTNVSVVSTSPTKPVIDAAGPKTVCLNSTGNVYTTQAGNSEYAWSIVGGEFTSGGGVNDYTATVTWTTSGPQSISVNFNSGTCSAPAPTAYQVTVNPLPTATVATNNASVCQNDPSMPVITFTGANGISPYTFIYTINGGAIQTAASAGNSATVSVPTGTVSDFTYQLVSVSGTNTCSQDQNSSVLVTVNPLPAATIGGTTTVCKGSAKPDITFTGSNGTAPYTFTYTINGVVQPVISTIATLNSIALAASTDADGTFAYTLVSVKDAKGCTQVVTGQTATITVNPLPTATMTAPSALCLNDVNSITFTGANGSAPYTFIYTINGGANQTAVTTIGNSVEVPISSSVANTFIYNLISVKDGASTACVQNQTGSVTVSVSSSSFGGTLTGAKTVCSGTNTGTLSLGANKVGNVVRWQSSADDGATWVNISNISSSLTYSNLTDTTQYRAVVQSGTCGEAFSNAVTISVNKANGGTIVESNKTRCAGDSGSIILKQNSGPVLQWETSTNGGVTWIVTASSLPYRDYLNITQTTWFRALSQATSCAAVYSDTAKIIVNARPGATIDNVLPVCIGGSTTLTIHLTGVGAISGTLSDGTSFSGTSASPVLVSVTPNSSTVYKIGALSDLNCPALASDLISFSTVVVNPLPAPVVINPGNTSICSGTILPLTSVLTNAGNFTQTYSSVASIAIPDNNTNITSSVTVPAGTIPIGAIFDSLSVNFNITHPDVSDLSINLAAPNGKAISLAVFSLSGQNLTNTTVSSRTSQHPVITTGSSPYTSTYSAEGDGLLIGAQDNPTANTRNFTDLFGTTINPANGTWSLKVRDNFAGNAGTLNNWKLTIYYHVPVNPVNIVWSPLDSLFTDPSAKVPYTGDARPTVYAKPSATTIYTGRASDTNSCTTASNVTVTVTEAPVVKIVADYCAVPSKVQLTASSVPPAYAYIWNTGETTPVISVDEAKLYTVSARTSLNCVATGIMSIAQELVKNGDFEAGNTGFYSQYGFVNAGGSLVPEGLYAVDSNAHNYHNNFFGKDHTTPNQTGKFMIVNGYGSSKLIWQETVNVLPNTNYYYSAYAMNLNTAGTPPSFAKLQFSVNGVPIGSAATNGIADLSTAPKPANAGMVNINNWQRFYYGNTDGWNSGTATTAVIQIINLNPDLSGNDFGLDDISFATLSTFITITSAPGTDAQVLCRSNPLTNITYTVGSGGTPTVTGLPKGVSAEFKNGITLVISGAPEDTAGVYHYTITTTGSCSNPTTATGTITVQAQKVTLTTPLGSDSQSICVNSPITPIKYALSQLATNATVTGLPAGVLPTVSGNVVTISGTPTVAGSFTYKIKTVGSSCNADSLTGTINSTVQTISAVTNNIQSVCIDNAIADIVYTIGGSGTNASVLGLPAGVTGAYDPLAKTYTLSGKPSVSGTFNYTVTTLGICNAAAATGTITVSPNAAISLTSATLSDAQEICFNTGITNITYTITGVTDANINVSGLPSGFSWTVQSGKVTISGTSSAAGLFSYTVNANGSCVKKTMGGTIKVDQPANAGNLSSSFASLCSTPTGILTLAGSTGTIKNWESSVDGGNTWSVISNTNSTYNFLINTTTYFRVVLNGGVCGDTYSNPLQLGVHNLWSGKVSSDWNDANNWSDGNLPSISCADVVIPGGMPHQPTLGSGSATIINLKIQNGAILTLDNATLKIAGTIENSGTFNAKTGTLDLNSLINPQTIPANTFQGNALGNLVITNSTASGITLAGKLDVYQSLIFGAGGKNLSTGGLLTMKSTTTQTAWVGDLTGHAINGVVTVERYINIGNQPGQHGKAWEFLAVPTKGQTVNQSWMEGNAPGVNSTPGYGTQITGIGGTANGFDVASPSPSMKYYDPASSLNWTGIANTSIPIFNRTGYMLFVRGDRSVNGQSVTNPKPTTLRTTGDLITGTQNLAVTASPGSFTSIGNPYAAPIDMRKVMLDKTWTSAGNDNFVTVWNSNIGGIYGYGVYQTYTQLNPGGDFIAVPGADVNNYIQSGQAFFIQNTIGNAGNVVIKEQSKAGVSSGLTTYFRPEGITQRVAQLRTNLFTLNADGTQYLSDGTLQQFDAGYSNGIDGMDGKKIFNSSENLSIKSGGKDLIVERRQNPKQQDTIYYSLTSVKVQTYRLEFTASSFSPSFQGYIEDIYLGTKKALDSEGKTILDFAVTNVAASYAANRFRIVFKTAAALPVTFASVKGYAKGADIAVDWKVESESNMKQYEVEKSLDGSSFSGVAILAAANSGAGTYNWLDKHASPGNNYYRIKSIDKNGKINYTEIVKVQMGNIEAEISVFPNPVVNGIINLKFTNQPAGRYNIRLLNALGQMIAGRQVERMEGNGSESLNWDYNLAHGIYQLEITRPNRDVKVIKLIY